MYGFRKEMLNKYDSDLYDLVMDVFDCLPLACVAQEKYFAMHGGISPDLKYLSDIDKLDRYHEPPEKGLMCDLLWADPVAKNADDVEWKESKRGCSYQFGNKALSKLLENNKFETVVRAH